MFDLTKLKTKTRNPRKISDRDFEKLMGSVQEFPKMLTLRPIVYDPVTMEVLGGNQRLRALLSAGYKSIPDEWVKSAEDLTEEEKKRFVVQDNVEAGDWDFEILPEDYDIKDLEAWGVDIPSFKNDYFDVTEDGIDSIESPSAKDDEYSKFELIMLHDNKLSMLDEINWVRNKFSLEKIEDGLMRIINEHKALRR